MNKLLLINIAIIIVGCGYRGDLYLPKKTAIKQESVAIAVESNENYVFESAGALKYYK